MCSGIYQISCLIMIPLSFDHISAEPLSTVEVNVAMTINVKVQRAFDCYAGAEQGDNCPGAKSLRARPKSPNSITSTSFNTEHLLPKDLRFDHGGAKLSSCPGRHLTSLRPYDSKTFLLSLLHQLHLKKWTPTHQLQLTLHQATTILFFDQMATVTFS